MANALSIPVTGFNYRLTRERTVDITSITLEDGTVYKTSDGYGIDMRHEGAYIWRSDTNKGMMIPARLVIRVDFDIRVSNDTPSFSGFKNVTKEKDQGHANFGM